MAMPHTILQDIGTQLATNGVVTIGPVISQNDINASIAEIISHLEGQPRVPGREIRFPRTNDNTVQISGLTKAQTDTLKSNWVPYVTFGAPVEPPAYNMRTEWSIRQSPRLYDIFRHVLQTDNLRVSIDRYKAKLPGTGEREFLHWDSNPQKWQFGIENTDLQGIVALTEIEFVCVPGTHTQQFKDLFLERYNGLVRFDNITKIDKNNDPLQLGAREQRFTVPPGHMIIWDSKVLHASYPNKTKDIKLAYYITYCIADRCLQPQEDRIQSYLTGQNPQIQPGGKILTYMPLAWKRFSRIAGTYHERIPLDRRYWRTGTTGQQLPEIREPVLTNYTPPALSELGYRLLWGRTEPPHL